MSMFLGQADIHIGSLNKMPRKKITSKDYAEVSAGDKNENN